MFTAQRRLSVVLVAAALCAASLSLGFFAAGTTSVQAQVASTQTVASQAAKPEFAGNFGQIQLVDGKWLDVTNVKPSDRPAQVRDQWIRGKLGEEFSTPECPINWYIMDQSGAKFYDSNFGTWSVVVQTRLQMLRGGLVEVHLLQNLWCMNEPEGEPKHWGLGTIEPQAGTRQVAWKAWLPILARNWDCRPSQPFEGYVGLVADGSPNMDWRLLDKCWHFVAHIENPELSWLGRYVQFNGTSRVQGGELWIKWDGSSVSFNNIGPACPNPSPTPTRTTQPHLDDFGVVEPPDDPRECAQAWLRLCLGGVSSRIALRHPDGPSFFVPWYWKEVRILAQWDSSCRYPAHEVVTISAMPGLCPIGPSPTPTRTPTPTMTPLPAGIIDGYVVWADKGCGVAELYTKCWSLIGYITNAQPNWDRKWVEFPGSILGVCGSNPMGLVLQWDSTRVRIYSTGPACDSTPQTPPTPVVTTPPPGPTTPCPPTDTPTPTRTATPTPTVVVTTPPPPPPSNTPTRTVTPTITSVPPTAIPGGTFTAYLVKAWPDDGWGECTPVLGILCGGEIVQVTNLGVFAEGSSYSFTADWMDECAHDDHWHHVLAVTSALSLASCPTGSVEVPPFRPCAWPLCWRYQVSERPGLLPLVLLLPYPSGPLALPRQPGGDIHPFRQ